jgi:Fic family protein
MRGSRGDHAEIGNFRRRQNWIGTRRSSPVTESLFVPPPPGDELDRGLDAWERWVNDAGIGLPSLIRVALAHYQFETLHPFIDGNGRVGRLLIVLTLMEHGDLKIPLLNVSPFFEDARDEYIDHLRSVSETGDFQPWVVFFAEAIQKQSIDALEKADELISLRDELVRVVHEQRVRGVALRITEDLIGYPFITPTRAAVKFDVSYQAANSAMARLVEIGILREATGGSYGRMFMSPRVLAVINR